MKHKELIKLEEIYSRRRLNAFGNNYTPVSWPAKGVWITWEAQRRTTELAKAIGIKLIRLNFLGNKILRYPSLCFKTACVLLKESPRIVIVQNPSLILTLLCTIYRILFQKVLIVDRHTNFMINKKKSIKKMIFSFISDFTLKYTDLTIVTNKFLKTYLENRGGNGFVLPDKIPELKWASKFPVKGEINIVFICSYADDEPVEMVIKAFSECPLNVHLYITGNNKGVEFSNETRCILKCHSNIELTGFLDDQVYINLLYSSDIIMDLTTFDHCVVCGAYEAVALEKALILSNKEANKEYFMDVPIYVENNIQSIKEGFAYAIKHHLKIQETIKQLKINLKNKWLETFKTLILTIENMQ